MPLRQAGVCVRRGSASGGGLRQAGVCDRRGSGSGGGLRQAEVCVRRGSASGGGLRCNVKYYCVRGVIIRGATDHKTHGSDHATVFESRVGSFSDLQQR